MLERKQKLIIEAFDKGKYRCHGDGTILRRNEIVNGTITRGYLQHSVSVDGLRCSAFAHQIVFLFFNRSIPLDLEINHRDGNRANNAISNLEAVTAKQNVRHAFDVIGRKPLRGEMSGMSKLTEHDVKMAKAMHDSGKSYRSIAKEIGVDPITISRAVRGITWSHV